MTWSQDYGKTFLEFVETSNKCNSQEQLNKLFKAELYKLGIDGYMYSLVRGSFFPSNKIIHGVAHSYPAGWVEHYKKNDYTKSDPTYRQILRSKGLFTWEELPQKMAYSKRDKLMMNEANESGLKSGMSLSLHGPYGQVFGFGFFSHDDHPGYSKDAMSILYAMANQFHMTYLNLEGEQSPPKPVRLTDRQREILQWSACGLSRPVIAEILHVSENTVDAHMKLIFKKLGCNDRILAVVKAIEMGLITV